MPERSPEHSARSSSARDQTCLYSTTSEAYADGGTGTLPFRPCFGRFKSARRRAYDCYVDAMSFLTCKHSVNIWRRSAQVCVAEDGKRIVEDYPPPATSIAGVTFDASELENNPWKVVPRDVDLSHWLRILPRTRRSATVREHAVLYDDSIRPPPSPNAPWTMTVSLYGFIDNMNLAPTGNWDLYDSRF